MPAHVRDVLSYLDTTLEIDRFRDYAPNGLQIAGVPEIETVVTGVSASAALLERAIELDADLVIVHHGLIWGGGIGRIEGPLARRLKLLLSHDMGLAAYHLPLDKHARLGNNVGLAEAIGLVGEHTWFGDVRGVALGLAGAFAAPLSREQAVSQIGAGVCGGEL
ncbi:MAG TPA: Nif3-like dinuclear metal center hexameric protein, partial [Kofleriaceae bacterium]|nr:Nif3-like dinuclear metal center hexameric protein [Kofleriaceae bacterium]